MTDEKKVQEYERISLHPADMERFRRLLHRRNDTPGPDIAQGAFVGELMDTFENDVS